MRRVLERCQQTFPGNNGDRVVFVQVKAWLKRKEIEDEMIRLKEHIQNCYAHFHVRSSYQGRSIFRTLIRLFPVFGIGPNRISTR